LSYIIVIVFQAIQLQSSIKYREKNSKLKRFLGMRGLKNYLNYNNIVQGVGANQEFMEIQLNQHTCRKKHFNDPVHHLMIFRHPL